MEKNQKINSGLKYEFSDGGYSVLISSEGRTEAVMREVLSQLERKFGEKLRTGSPCDKEHNLQIIFKEGCIPTGREITEIMSTLDIQPAPAKKTEDDLPAPPKEKFFRKLISKITKRRKN